MSRLAPLLLASVLATGCYTSAPGVVGYQQDSPLVTVTAGVARFGEGGYYGVAYIVDRASQTCWLTFGNSSIAAMDCCQLRRVKAVRKHITWETKASCADVSVAPPPEMPPAAAPPAAPVP